MGISDFFKHKTNASSTLNNNSVPYYLDDDIISLTNITSELKEWSNSGSLDINETYESKIKELENIKNNIIWTKDISHNNIEVCSKGLKLSIELCNYCIEHGYHANSFVRSQTKNLYIYFKENLEHWTIYNSFKEAEDLEKNGFIEKALDGYLKVLQNHIPIGTSYYQSPFYLCIQMMNFKTAHDIYTILQTNYNKTKNKSLESTLADLKNKLINFPCQKNMYDHMLNKILNCISNNPGIIQNELINNLNSLNKESIRFILYSLEKSNRIMRTKKGRSYTLNIV